MKHSDIRFQPQVGEWARNTQMVYLGFNSVLSMEYLLHARLHALAGQSHGMGTVDSCPSWQW